MGPPQEMMIGHFKMVPRAQRKNSLCKLRRLWIYGFLAFIQVSNERAGYTTQSFRNYDKLL